MSILKFENVSKSFGQGTSQINVLDGINLDIKEGEFVAILGFSGTGKSTLMNLVAGLEMPDAGSVTFKGARISGPGPERGLVFQSYSLMPWLTVGGNVGLAVDAVLEERQPVRRVHELERDRPRSLRHLVHVRLLRPAVGIVRAREDVLVLR